MRFGLGGGLAFVFCFLYYSPMSVALKQDFLSFEDYLEGELLSNQKHEYVLGTVYAMAGGTRAHSRISSNLLGNLFSKLDGNPCQPYNSDLKIRIPFPDGDAAYYPDLSIICEPGPEEQTFQENPVVVFEVLSPSTRRTDENEKKQAYLSIPSLQHYVLLESESVKATIYTRGQGPQGGFGCEVLHGLEAILRLTALDLEMPLGPFYQGLELPSS